MRALLVVNPKATTTTPKGRDVLARALASDMDVQVTETRNRGHAAALACHAAREGIDLVVAQGGDGTVNEVVNGLLTDGPGPNLPMLAVVPGGSTNVFARTLGIPNDPIEATGEILDALRTGRSRRIGLGQANDRWFTFTAGFGFDAEVVRRIERRRQQGHGITHARYVRAAVTHFLLGTDRRRPAVTFQQPGEQPHRGIYFVIVSNTSPWTYLGTRPLRPTPQASFDTALDVFAPQRMGTLRTLGYLGQTLRQEPRLRGRHLLRMHDVTEFTLTSDRPLALQVDGDYLGERRQVRFSSTPGVLRVLA
ncbi:MAG TPA: diacylglycerol kinase family protein [Mycobacteriales bacterium]